MSASALGATRVDVINLEKHVVLSRFEYVEGLHSPFGEPCPRKWFIERAE